MHRIFLEIAYDGSDFRGYQFQEGYRTVEGELGLALHSLLGSAVDLIGASRTDSGVHARGNVVCFDTESSIPGERFQYALRQYLPADLAVISSKEVPLPFHPRYDAHEKCYRYLVDRRKMPYPDRARYCVPCSFPLQLSEMRRAAALLTGTHDFRSFVNPDSQVLMRGGDSVRTIREIRIEERDAGEELALYFRGDGFLYHQIRIMTGTLLEVGRGRYQASDMELMLRARDRRKAGPTAAAKGLCLMKIYYDVGAKS